MFGNGPTVVGKTPMIILNQPGDEEDDIARPLAGPGGILLARLLEDAGIDIESYTIVSPERDLEQVIIGYEQVLEKAYKDLGPHQK